MQGLVPRLTRYLPLLIVVIISRFVDRSQLKDGSVIPRTNCFTELTECMSMELGRTDIGGHLKTRPAINLKVTYVHYS